MLKNGRVLASGPTDEVLTPERIRELYGVDADVSAARRDGPPDGRARQGGRARAAAVKPLGRRLAMALLLFGGAALGAIATAPLIGSTPISLRRAFDRVDSVRARMSTHRFSSSRGCRARLRGALVGSTLASAGVVFQGLLRNPLATPFTLGVSAGAALGAMLAITFGRSLAWLGVPLAPLASFAGSLVAVGDRLPAGRSAAPRPVHRTSCCSPASR